MAEHKFGCLLAVVPEPLRGQITDWVLENVPDFHLGEGGRESRPHVTVKYGFREPSEIVLPRLQQLLVDRGEVPFTCWLRDVSLFRGNDDGDVLKVDVDSLALRHLNSAITAGFDTEDKHPEYQPHVTLAYLDPSVSDSYLRPPPFLPAEFVVDHLEYVAADGETTEIPLWRLLGQPVKSLSYSSKDRGGSGESYFATCERDEEGHCRSGSGGKTSTRPKTKKPSLKPSKLGERLTLAPASPSRRAPGSQLQSEQRNRLRANGMVGTFPPADVPLDAIKVHEGSATELEFRPLMQWDQRTKSGRISRQYRYTQAFHDRNAAEKFRRVSEVEPHLGKAVASLRARMSDPKAEERDRDAAAIASVIAETGLRPTDNPESVNHGHYGIASLLGKHAKVKGNEIQLDFIGKEGVRNQTTVRDPANVAYLKQRLGKVGKNEPLWSASSDEAGALLKTAVTEAGGPDNVKLKDLRTIKATQTARKVVDTFRGPPPPLAGDPKKDAKAVARAILAMSGEVAVVLNNTPTQARDNYIHPEVFKQWQMKLTSPRGKKTSGKSFSDLPTPMMMDKLIPSTTSSPSMTETTPTSAKSGARLDDLSTTEKGLLDTVEAAGQWLAAKWTALEQRHGKRVALAMAVATLATMPIPGNVAAIIAAAEAIRGIGGAFSKSLTTQELAEMMMGKNLTPAAKDLSSLGETSGGALVPPPQQRLSPPRLGKSVFQQRRKSLDHWAKSNKYVSELRSGDTVLIADSRMGRKRERTVSSVEPGTNSSFVKITFTDGSVLQRRPDETVQQA